MSHHKEERTIPHAEALPGALPAAWFAPESRTDAGPGLGLCPACTHQTHGGVCGYQSREPDRVVACRCGA